MAFVFETRSESEKVNLTREDAYPWKPENFAPWWTIDRERDVFMLAIGGGAGKYYYLRHKHKRRSGAISRDCALFGY